MKDFTTRQILKKKIFTTRQILNRNFYNASDFEIKFLQRVRFSIKMSSDVEEKYFFEKHDFEENHIFKKHDFEENFIFKKYVFGEKKHF